jgi:hypothetical protein
MVHYIYLQHGSHMYGISVYNRPILCPSAVNGYCNLGKQRLVPVWHLPRSLTSTDGFQASEYWRCAKS